MAGCHGTHGICTTTVIYSLWTTPRERDAGVSVHGAEQPGRLWRR
jgi:hypothetical protein